MTINISVVIPLFYNERTIHRAVQSVLQQTYPYFELIIVNDGSKDKGCEMIRAFGDDRIRIIEQENQGVSAARNRGGEEASYDYVAFLDADDEWLPEYLERMVKLINKYPGCGIYGSASLRFDGKHTYRFLLPVLDLSYGWEGVFENYFEYVDYILPYHTSAVIVSREAFRKVGGFPIGIRCWQDTDLWMKIAVQYKTAFINIPLSVFHLETENSGSKIYATYEELQGLIEKWNLELSEGNIPPQYEKSFREFLGRYQVMCAKIYLSKGKNRSARNMLNEILPTSRYSEKAKTLKRRTYIPRFLFKVLLAFYSRLKWIFAKFEHHFGLDV